RIDTALFDDLIVRSEELLLPRLAAAERAQQARSLAPLLSRCRALLKAVREQPQAARQPLFDQLADALDQGERLAGGLQRGLDRLDRGLRGAVDGVLDGMRRVRMTPAASVLDLLPGMAQDLARSAGKDIRCAIEGGQLPIDRLVLQAIKDPLIHLVRNAVDHGIEPSEARRAGGKPVPGVISIAVHARDGARVGITVADDGGGIDLEGVTAAAIRRRIMTAEAVEQMSEPQILQLVLRSGLSTRPVVTEISGHGMGLAVVAARVERLGGSIAIENRPGSGASFAIDLPASVVSFHGLLVRAQRQSFLLPLDAVETVARIRRRAGAMAIEIGGQPTACGSLTQVLGLDRDDDAADGVFVVVVAGGERAAFRVDEVLGDREVLLRPIQPPLARVRNIAGAGLLGTGELALVLRPADLLRSLRRVRSTDNARPAPPARRRRPTILVVDDSLTTRMMEKNLLEALGYGVRIAADGAEAWHLLADDEIDLVVSDVDMPRMNGFELTERIRADRRLADLPVILVSALEARDDKAQGIRAGANAYVVKSGFENTNLQEMIERFL
ncbi:MAG TPA: response regulator, partial [Stellaceae bacterium]|nr:response regulator [Stellaceae bacterium]